MHENNMTKIQRDLRDEFHFISTLESINSQQCLLNIKGNKEECIVGKKEDAYFVKTHDSFLRPITDSNFRFLNINNGIIELEEKISLTIVSSHISKWSSSFSPNIPGTKFRVTKWETNNY